MGHPGCCSTQQAASPDISQGFGTRLKKDVAKGRIFWHNSVVKTKLSTGKRTAFDDRVYTREI
jgi:hypothetical protein